MDKMPPFTKKRESLMQLRPKHLLWVEELGIREDYDRDWWLHYMLDRYNALFGKLRRHEVASDSLRKFLMVSRLLDIAEGRRAEYARERSSRSS